MRPEALAERATGWPPGFLDTAADRRAALVLLHLLGMAPRDLSRAAHEAGNASGLLAAVREGRAGSARDRTFLEALDAGPGRAGLMRRIEDCGARVVLAGDPEYPAGLADLADPPLGLFVRGRALDPARPGVAIVGARGCTPYGAEMARALGRGLAAAGAVVVSGAARGIDAAAHEGALDAEGHTVAVLGCGIDRAYPVSSRGLLEHVARAGSIVSEYPPGTHAEPFRFPARNRIVAGMTRAVVVVEGAPGSGSMITVDHANDCGREVFAVPGPVTAPLSAVPNDLIRTGVPLVRDAADVLSDLGLGEGAAAFAVPELPPPLASLLGGLGGAPQAPESIAARAGLSVTECLMGLLDLEMRGLVRRSGGRFERTLLAGG